MRCHDGQATVNLGIPVPWSRNEVPPRPLKRRKVTLGTCGGSFGTGCMHERGSSSGLVRSGRFGLQDLAGRAADTDAGGYGSQERGP